MSSCRTASLPWKGNALNSYLVYSNSYLVYSIKCGFLIIGLESCSYCLAETKSVYLARFNCISVGVDYFLWISASTEIGKYLAPLLI